MLDMSCALSVAHDPALSTEQRTQLRKAKGEAITSYNGKGMSMTIIQLT